MINIMRRPHHLDLGCLSRPVSIFDLVYPILMTLGRSNVSPAHATIFSEKFEWRMLSSGRRCVRMTDRAMFGHCCPRARRPMSANLVNFLTIICCFFILKWVEFACYFAFLFVFLSFFGFYYFCFFVFSLPWFQMTHSNHHLVQDHHFIGYQLQPFLLINHTSF